MMQTLLQIDILLKQSGKDRVLSDSQPATALFDFWNSDQMGNIQEMLREKLSCLSFIKSFKPHMLCDPSKICVSKRVHRQSKSKHQKPKHLKCSDISESNVRCRKPNVDHNEIKEKTDLCLAQETVQPESILLSFCNDKYTSGHITLSEQSNENSYFSSMNSENTNSDFGNEFSVFRPTETTQVLQHKKLNTSLNLTQISCGFKKISGMRLVNDNPFATNSILKNTLFSRQNDINLINPKYKNLLKKPTSRSLPRSQKARDLAQLLETTQSSCKSIASRERQALRSQRQIDWKFLNPSKKIPSFENILQASTDKSQDADPKLAKTESSKLIFSKLNLLAASNNPIQKAFSKKTDMKNEDPLCTDSNTVFSQCRFEPTLSPKDTNFKYNLNNKIDGLNASIKLPTFNDLTESLDVNPYLKSKLSIDESTSKDSFDCPKNEHIFDMTNGNQDISEQNIYNDKRPTINSLSSADHFNSVETSNDNKFYYLQIPNNIVYNDNFNNDVHQNYAQQEEQVNFSQDCNNSFISENIEANQSDQNTVEQYNEEIYKSNKIEPVIDNMCSNKSALNTQIKNEVVTDPSKINYEHNLYQKFDHFTKQNIDNNFISESANQKREQQSFLTQPIYFRGNICHSQNLSDIHCENSRQKSSHMTIPLSRHDNGFANYDMANFNKYEDAWKLENKRTDRIETKDLLVQHIIIPANNF